ncbi:hypothetical protein HN446_02790 [bacterium]|jgi:hypothetical protein|nr:hypothetical protein [bacterium]
MKYKYLKNKFIFFVALATVIASTTTVKPNMFARLCGELSKAISNGQTWSTVVGNFEKRARKFNATFTPAQRNVVSAFTSTQRATSVRGLLGLIRHKKHLPSNVNVKSLINRIKF